MMTLTGYLKVIRPVNAFVSGLTAALAVLIATGRLDGPVPLLIAVVTLVTGAGNVINDYFDYQIDLVNRPDRPIPSGTVSLAGARRYAILLFIVGVLLSFGTTPLCALLAVFNTLLLVLYAARLKAVPLIGNLTVSYLAGSIFIFGGALSGTTGELITLPIAAITFLGMVARELLKDGEDIEGDLAGGARTLPMLIGIQKTGWIAFLFALAGIGTSFLPYLTWGQEYLALIALPDLLILAGALQGLRSVDSATLRNSRATLLLKGGMFTALAAFTASALIL
jgi:geranylgeranylglycerol-phosphate geranylgeranyltransferase